MTISNESIITDLKDLQKLVHRLREEESSKNASLSVRSAPAPPVSDSTTQPSSAALDRLTHLIESLPSTERVVNLSFLFLSLFFFFSLKIRICIASMNYLVFGNVLRTC